MFCSNCGRKLPDDAGFCTACGQKVNGSSHPIPVSQQQSDPVSAPQQPVYQQPVQPANEQVLMVWQTYRKYSMLKMATCHVVFMNDKIVLAYLSKERQKAESDRLSQEIKASGKGFFKGSAAMMSYWSDYYKKYYQMSSQQILAEDPENIMIPNHAVSQLLFHAHDTNYSSDGSERTTGGKLNITPVGGETLKFTHTIGNNRTIRDTLTQLFGQRLKYKR